VKRHSDVEIACRRLATRFPVAGDDAPFVEFALEDGSHWQCSVLEISAIGIGFGVDKEHSAFAVGKKIDRATIWAGASRVEGSLRIIHLTPTPSTGIICGAEFRPKTDTDDLALMCLLIRLDDAASRTV
jgi:hypothetical protein